MPTDASGLMVRLALEDARRYLTALFVSAGLAPIRAAGFAGHILWHDLVGIPEAGLAGVAAWLERLRRGDCVPDALGRIVSEEPGSGLVIVDAQRGLPGLVLSRAADIARENTRLRGSVLIRIRNLPDPIGPTIATTSDLAVGPRSAALIGPDGSFSWALPTRMGLPLAYESALAPKSETDRMSEFRLDPPDLAVARLFWSAMTQTGECVMFVEHAGNAHCDRFRLSEEYAQNAQHRPGWLFPIPQERYRREIAAAGIPVPNATYETLASLSDGIGVRPPKAHPA